MEETLTRRSRPRRLAFSAFTLSVLLSLIAAPPAGAQDDAPIFSWGGTVEVSTTTLEIPEGGAASYSLRLTQQPSDSSRECCGWWVMLRVDDTDDTDDTISWIPSVGWEFKRQEGATGPTAWRGVSIRAEEDDDTDDEVIVFRHEVWDENSNCPDSLHPDSLPVVRVTIIDNDRPGGQPRLSIADTSVVEGDTAQFNVSLTSKSAQPVTVSWATADGTAKEGTDYEARMATLTIPAGETVRQISVPTVEDDFHEPAERFRVTLSGASGATLADASGEATISDDDLPELSIDNASPVTEGGTARFLVTLTPAHSSQTVTVEYETQGDTATEGTDYTARSGTLTFTSGDRTETILVPTTDDNEQESDERFTVVLSSPTAARLNDATGEGTVTDNDSGPTMPELSIADTSVVEGDTAQFNVSLTSESAQPVTVSWATADGTAKEGTDYEARTATLTIPAGETVRQISVPTVEDDFHEPAERFRVTLSGASGATLADASGEATISDDDLPELSIDNASPVTEGGTARFLVTLTPAHSSQTVTVEYETQGDTATEGTDYTARSGTLTFTSGDRTETILVPTTDDNEQESDERFTVVLSSPTAARLNDATGEGMVTDNDSGPTMPELSIGDASVDEGGAAQFEVRLTPTGEQTVTVSYATVDGTAASPADYMAQSGMLTFMAGDMTMTISVLTEDDTEQESNERFTVVLSDASGATLNDVTSSTRERRCGDADRRQRRWRQRRQRRQRRR